MKTNYNGPPASQCVVCQNGNEYFILLQEGAGPDSCAGLQCAEPGQVCCHVETGWESHIRWDLVQTESCNVSSKRHFYTTLPVRLSRLNLEC